MTNQSFPRTGSNNLNLVFVITVVACVGIFAFITLRKPPDKGASSNDSSISPKVVPPEKSTESGEKAKSATPEKPIESGEKAKSATVVETPEKIDKKGDKLPPETLKEFLPQGAKYEITRKFGIVVRGKDRDWRNPNELIMIGVYAETRFIREVEKNDGDTFVEVRHTEKDRAVKVLSSMGRFEFNLENSQSLLLSSLVFPKPDTLLPLDIKNEDITQIFAKSGSSPIEGGKLFKVGSGIEKKKVRIISKKGKGVVSVEPIDCELDEEGNKYFHTQTPFVLPTQLAENMKPGESVTIPAWLLRECLEDVNGEDPSTYTTGKVVLKRDVDIKEEGDSLASFLILKEGSQLKLASDEKEAKVNMTLVPLGSLKFSKSEKCIRQIDFVGNLEVFVKPKNKSFGNAIFSDKPLLRNTYYCKKIAG